MIQCFSILQKWILKKSLEWFTYDCILIMYIYFLVSDEKLLFSICISSLNMQRHFLSGTLQINFLWFLTCLFWTLNYIDRRWVASMLLLYKSLVLKEKNWFLKNLQWAIDEKSLYNELLWIRWKQSNTSCVTSWESSTCNFQNQN